MKDTPLNDILFFHVEKMMKAAKEHTMSVFKENNFPVTKDQWIVLKRAADEDGSSQREIASATFKDPAAITRILDLLVKKGLLRRQASTEDRRTFEIFLTVEGKRLVDKMTPFVKEIRAKALEGISASDHDKMKTLLQKMERNLL